MLALARKSADPAARQAGGPISAWNLQPRKPKIIVGWNVGCISYLSEIILLKQVLILYKWRRRGIRTLDRALQPYNGLANRRIKGITHTILGHMLLDYLDFLVYERCEISEQNVHDAGLRRHEELAQRKPRRLDRAGEAG